MNRMDEERDGVPGRERHGAGYPPKRRPRRKPTASCSRGKPLSSARSRLDSLCCTVPRRRARLKRVQQVSANRRYLVNSGKERRFIGFRWLVEAAYFSHELQRGPANLVVRHRRFEVEKGFDVSTHKRYLDVSGPSNVDRVVKSLY